MTKYSVNKNYIYQIKNSKNILIFDSSRSMIFDLNETATIVFNKLRLGWGDEKIKKFLLTKFKVGKKLIDKQLHGIIKQLLKNNILIH